MDVLIELPKLKIGSVHTLWQVKAKFLPILLKQIALAKHTAYPSLSNEGLRSQTRAWQPAKPQDANSLPTSIFGTPGSLKTPRGLQQFVLILLIDSQKVKVDSQKEYIRRESLTTLYLLFKTAITRYFHLPYRPATERSMVYFSIWQ